MEEGSKNFSNDCSSVNSSEESFQRHWRNSTLGEKISNGEWTQEHTTFTIMSYNVLADDLMKRHSNLYNQPMNILEWNQRWGRMLEEIKTYDPDILCCQEVQCNHFISHFVPNLNNLNYEGLYKKRTGGKEDGCAIFYKKDKFILEEFTEIEYHQPYIQSLDRDNIALVAKFRPTKRPYKDGNYGGDSFVVATTHLLYNPKREDVRLAQIALLLAELDRFAYKSKSDLECCPPKTRQDYFYPCILTGDFNLNPGSPIYNFINTGYLNYSGMGSRRNVPLLPLSLGITDNCQHLNSVLSRCSSLLSRNSEGNVHAAVKSTQLYKGRTEIIFTHNWLR
jgi:protein angel